MPVARLILFCLVGGFVAGPAAAGPIWVSYQFDSVALPVTDGPAGHVKLEQHFGGRANLETPRRIATFRFIPSVPSSTSTGITRIGERFEGVSRFAMQVELTDEESGESGALKVTGAARSSWDRSEDGRGIPVDAAFFFDDVQPRTVTLGGRSYELDLVGGSSKNGDMIQATVSVLWSSPSVQSVPEPGTLLLAGAGLAGLVIRRRRSKLSS